MAHNENDDISFQTNTVTNNIQDTHENVIQPCDTNSLNYSELLRRSVNAPINNREPPNEDEEDSLNEHWFPAGDNACS